MSSPACGNGVVGIGSAGFLALRATLVQALGEEAGATQLQQAGFAAGTDVFHQFTAWLPDFSGVNGIDQLDADTLDEVLAAYFAALGWGAMTVERRTARGLVLASADWVEADASAEAPYPSCYFTTGLLAGLLTSLAGGQPLAAMEVACRQHGDSHCRFLAGSPEMLEAVYQAATEGRDYEAVIGA
jgi:hypothetical protein